MKSVFQFLSVVLIGIRRTLLWGLLWGSGSGGGFCGLVFVVLFAHVEGSDGGLIIVEPIGCLVQRLRLRLKDEVEIVVSV